MQQRYIIQHYQTEDERDVFRLWLESLNDTRAKTRVTARLYRVLLGNFGDHKYLDQGVWELRIDYGPGYRIYYCLEGTTVVLLLCGGAKGSQQADITRAKACRADHERRKRHDG